MSKRTVMLILGGLLIGVVGYLFASESISGLVFNNADRGLQVIINTEDKPA